MRGIASIMKISSSTQAVPSNDDRKDRNPFGHTINEKARAPRAHKGPCIITGAIRFQGVLDETLYGRSYKMGQQMQELISCHQNKKGLHNCMTPGKKVGTKYMDLLRLEFGKNQLLSDSRVCQDR